MKRYVCLLLTVVLILGLCACGSSGEEKTAGLQMGFAMEKIMPSEPVPLGGYGNTSARFHQNVLDFLYTTCIAAKEGEEIVLFFTNDLLLPNNAWVNAVREMLSIETGVPQERILLSFTHTHSGPDIFSAEPVMKDYKQLFVEQAVKAGKAALADLAPATLYAGKTVAEDMNAVRHYLLKDGSYGGDNFGNFSLGIVEHAEPNDDEMILLKAEREGEKKDILIVNWQAHPCKTGGSSNYDMSADFPGAIRDTVMAQTDMLCAYFSGACGNQNTSSRIPGESKSDSMDKVQMGEAMAKIALDAVPNLQPVGGEGIATQQVIFEYAYNHDDEHMYVQAQQVADYWTVDVSNTEAATYAKSLGFSSAHHAKAVLARMKRAQSGTMELDAVRIGNFAFVTAPYEMFASHGVYIKDNSPFENTMVFECSNQYQSYIPTAAAYDYGCYESYTSIFAKGAGEAAAEKFVDMLKSLS